MKKLMLFGMACFMGSATYAESVEDKVLAIMEEMGAAKKLKRLDKKKDYKNADWKKYSMELIEQYNGMKDIKHEEKMFNDFNAEMFKALEDYKKVLAGTDYDAIAKSWKAVGAACKACHEEYK
ncbi:cytochrome c [Lentisphaera profundi]|uniref:Cytochrome c n=1 Tax=Lentisphaera profundi TaxID=1658616 RepID=A0ABY7VVD4_9BACT|nr:cytochrome c [Lentisphaera profundi]WDE96699.1 cytochrome c [Lentisphaera profundi]